MIPHKPNNTPNSGLQDCILPQFCILYSYYDIYLGSKGVHNKARLGYTDHGLIPMSLCVSV